MSTFSQFTGGGPPFGQALSMSETRANPTVNGVEYLRAGVLKSATGYSTFVSNWPTFTYNIPTGGNYNMPTTGSHVNILTDGTRYYFLRSESGITKVPYTTNLTTDFSDSSSFITATAARSSGSCRLGTSGSIIISIDNQNNNSNFYISGTTATNFSTTYTMNVCASNTAGTLAVVASFAGAGQPGAIATSTNGQSWTERTVSGGSNNYFYRATWCPVGNCFIYVSWNDQKVWTATDGYTIVDRGKPGNISTGGSWSNSYSLMNNHYCASSSSSTLISIQDNTSTGWIIKTTNGTSFTATSVSDFFGGLVKAGAATIPKLYYFNNAYYALFTSGNQTYAHSDLVLLKSTDEGNTWSFVALPLVPALASFNNYASTVYHLTVLNGNIVAVFMNTSYYIVKYAVLSSYDTATHIGRVMSTTITTGTSNYEYQNIYYRIK